ncbi:MAG: hypothetical protein AB2A00_19800, partial [Myxococcota bacterium]
LGFRAAGALARRGLAPRWRRLLVLLLVALCHVTTVAVGVAWLDASLSTVRRITVELLKRVDAPPALLERLQPRDVAPVSPLVEGRIAGALRLELQGPQGGLPALITVRSDGSHVLSPLDLSTLPDKEWHVATSELGPSGHFVVTLAARTGEKETFPVATGMVGSDGVLRLLPALARGVSVGGMVILGVRDATLGSDGTVLALAHVALELPTSLSGMWSRAAEYRDAVLLLRPGADTPELLRVAELPATQESFGLGRSARPDEVVLTHKRVATLGDAASFHAEVVVLPLGAPELWRPVLSTGMSSGAGSETLVDFLRPTLLSDGALRFLATLREQPGRAAVFHLARGGKAEMVSALGTLAVRQQPVPATTPLWFAEYIPQDLSVGGAGLLAVRRLDNGPWELESTDEPAWRLDGTAEIPCTREGVKLDKAAALTHVVVALDGSRFLAAGTCGDQKAILTATPQMLRDPEAPGWTILLSMGDRWPKAPVDNHAPPGAEDVPRIRALEAQVNENRP